MLKELKCASVLVLDPELELVSVATKCFIQNHKFTKKWLKGNTNVSQDPFFQLECPPM